MKAIFPGSFDPIHLGHINIIKKSIKIFKILYVIVANNINKKKQTNIKNREKKISEICKKISKNIIVINNNDELISEIAKKLNIKYLIRGLRNENDFKYEIELAFNNKKINNKLETIFFISDFETKEISSTLIKKNKKIYNKK